MENQYKNPLTKWMGVDFDGTLATDFESRKELHDSFYILGLPIAPMVARITTWLRLGIEVRIFTSRVTPDGVRDVEKVRSLIQDWCEKYVGKRLEVTNIKGHGLIHLWDDKAITIEYNTGLTPWEVKEVKWYE